jgi:hypothetical protein
MTEPLSMDQAFIRKLTEIVLTNLTNENGLLLGNNFSNTAFSVASVFLEPYTRNWTIVGGNLGESIIDLGENNIITGFNMLDSEDPFGQTIVDNLEEWREAMRVAHGH